MLLKLIDFFEPTNALKKPYRGIVVWNADPKRLGRIKVLVPGLIEANEVSLLPWCYPLSPAGLGGKGASSFQVPDVNSEVIVEFPFDDVYSPHYTGVWQSEETHPGHYDEDYPRSYGTRDAQGNSFKVNRAKGYSEFEHSSGSRIRMTKDSAIEIRAGKSIKLSSLDEVTSFAFDMETGSFNLNPNGDMTLGGKDLKITSRRVMTTVSSIEETISGSKVVNVSGGNKLITGGSNSVSVLGEQAVTVAGDNSVMVAGKESRTIGTGVNETIVAGNRAVKMLAGDDKLSIVVGNHQVECMAGNVSITTLAGTAKFGSTVGKIEIDAAGGIKVTNPMAKLEMNVAGMIKMEGQVKVEVKGNAMTQVGSGSGVTKVDGSVIMLGGGGPPIARMSDTVLSIGNLGAPCIGNIMSGSGKVLSG